MRHPYYLIPRGDFWYYRLNRESGLVGRNDKTWHTTGCKGHRVAEKIMKREILTILKNPARENQKIFVVSVRGDTYCVPFVEDVNGNITLKNAYPRRKLNRRYGGTRGGKKP